MGRWKKDATACPSGHALSTENIYVHPSGRRYCNVCRRERNFEWGLRNPSYNQRKNADIWAKAKAYDIIMASLEAGTR